VAEDEDGASVGLLGALPDDGRIHLVGMWVDPACRGVGTAAALVEAAADFAAAEGIHVLHLHVSGGNDRARRFYRRVGFEETGTADDFGRLLGVEMVRRLRPSPPTPAGPAPPTSAPG
jgi:ribosomal protein S18 acetylase RimI-like enzyme